MKQKPQRLLYVYNPRANDETLKKLTSEPNWENIVNILNTFNIISYIY